MIRLSKPCAYHGAPGEALIVNRRVRILYRAWEQADSEVPGWRLGKLLEHHGYHLRGCDIAEVQPADAIRDHKHPAVRSRFLSGSGNKCAHGIFVVGAEFAWVRGLSKDYVQHERPLSAMVRLIDSGVNVHETSRMPR